MQTNAAVEQGSRRTQDKEGTQRKLKATVGRRTREKGRKTGKKIDVVPCRY